MFRKLFFTLLICGGLYLAAQPYLTAYGMQSASVRNDPVTLARSVDFPLLKQNLKRHLADVVRKQMGGELRGSPYADLVVSLSSAVIDPVVEQTVTAEAMIEMMIGRNPLGGGGVSETNPTGERHLLDGAAMRYESHDRFVITVDNGTSLDDLRLILQRRGLRWVMVEVLLPV